jgi:type II secretory pathway predicted ATPase ExeA
MYYEFFGFNQAPFKITPDTNLFYPGGNRGAVLEALLYAIRNGEGIVKVVGEVGSGKTMLCRMLEKELPESVEVVYLVNPSISPENTLHAIAFELSLDVKPDTSRFEVMNALQEYLLNRHSENRQVVVFVEEAQAMPIATLEEIRLLSNLETQQSKLLQIVLFGQPELDTMISQPQIRQLKERITYSFDLPPFKTNDVREYLNSRVRACGYRAGELFDDSAVNQIGQYSRGLLRRINILADKALLAAYSESAKRVQGRHTQLAARDSEFIGKSKRYSPWMWSVAAAVILVVFIGLFLYFRTGVDRSFSYQPRDEAADAGELPPTPPQPGSETQSGEITLEQDLEVQQIPPQTDINEDTVTQVRPAGPMPATVNSGPVSEVILPVQDDVPPEQGEAVGLVAEPVAAPPENTARQPVFQLQIIADPRLSVEEFETLNRQIQGLPPESAEYDPSSLQGEVCRHCWSIIYRPLWTSENL